MVCPGRPAAGSTRSDRRWVGGQGLILADNVVGVPGLTVMSPISIPGTRRTAGDFALPPRNAARSDQTLGVAQRPSLASARRTRDVLTDRFWRGTGRQGRTLTGCVEGAAQVESAQRNRART